MEQLKNYKPLEFHEIRLSGAFLSNFFRKMLEALATQNHEHVDVERDRQGVEFSCNVFTLRVENSGYYSITAPEKIIEQLQKLLISETNNYLQKIISLVEDEAQREKIIAFSGNENSKKSSFHIFNIEILCSCANKKPDRFDLLYALAQDYDMLNNDTDNYEFYLFAILDVEDIQTANEIYDNLMERAEATINYFDTETRRIPNFRGYVTGKLSSKELTLVQENIDKLELI